MEELVVDHLFVEDVRGKIPILIVVVISEPSLEFILGNNVKILKSTKSML